MTDPTGLAEPAAQAARGVPPPCPTPDARDACASSPPSSAPAPDSPHPAAARPRIAPHLPALLVFLLVGFPLYLHGIGRYGLTYPEESLKNEMARAMAENGDWLVPRLNGEPRLTKPPMVVWLTALSFRCFGADEWAARLPSALFGLGTIAAVYLLGFFLYDRRSALLAAAAFGLALGPFYWSRSQAQDPALTCWVTWSLLGFARALLGAEPRTGWLALGYGAAAIGSLGKGPLGLLLPLLAVLAYGGLSGTLRADLRRLRLGWGLALCLAPLVAWGLAVELRCPGTARNFVLNEMLARFAGKKWPLDYTTLPIYEFVGWYLIFLFPVSLFLPLAGLAAWRARGAGWSAEERRGWLFPLCWIAAVLGFFCLSRSRLTGYSSPAMPAAALLAGRALGAALDARCGALRWTPGAACALLALIAGAGAGFLPAVLTFFGGDLRPEILTAVRLWCCAGLAIGAGLGALAWLAGARRAGLAAAGIGLVALCVGIAEAHRIGAENYSYRQAGVYIRRAPDAAAALVVIPRPKELGVVGGLNFYARHHVRILLRPGQADFAQEVRRPELVYLNECELAGGWLARRIYFVTSKRSEAEALAARMPGAARIVGPLGNFWLVTQANTWLSAAAWVAVDALF